MHQWTMGALKGTKGTSRDQELFQRQRCIKGSLVHQKVLRVREGIKGASRDQGCIKGDHGCITRDQECIKRDPGRIKGASMHHGPRWEATCSMPRNGSYLALRVATCPLCSGNSQERMLAAEAEYNSGYSKL
eukprot:scaffold216044_cov22-Tisochrysis_lutea.AAC.1